LRFSDGSEGEVDLAELVLNDHRPIVAALRDPVSFTAMRVDMDTVVWDNGFDLAPVDLKLTPFRGHLILMEEGVRNAEAETSISGAVSPADGRTGASRPHAGAAVA
jgi:hypothetical protein